MATSYRLFGNRDLAAFYRGEAHRLLWILKNRLELVNFPQGRLTRNYPDGTAISVQVCYGNDIINISCVAGGEKKKITNREWFIFLFYTPTKFKVYRLLLEESGITSLKEIILPTDSVPPFPYTWYSSYLNAEKDPTPAVISTGSNKYHYINTVVDPVISPAGNGYDDWHYHNTEFRPTGWLWDNMVREAPTAFPTLMMTHFSISPHTYFSSFYYRQGGILQNLRQYCAEKSLVPLVIDTIPVETEIPNDGPGAYGRRGFTLDTTGRYATSWKERVYASGVAVPWIYSNVGVPWLTWFFFPWIPYLNEISGFPILDGGSGYVIPTVKNPQIYSMGYIDATGPKITNPFLSDQASYDYSDGGYSVSTTPIFNQDIVRVVPGGPGGWSYAGSWPDQGVGSFSYTLTTTGHQIISASASGRYNFPVGSVGNKEILIIQNDFTISILYDKSLNSTFSKTTVMPYHFYVLWSGIEEYWLANGDYVDSTSGTQSNSITESRAINLTQRLLFRDIAIETLISTLTYEYENIEIGSGAFDWTFHQDSKLPMPIWDSYYIHNPGSATLNKTISADVIRNIQTVEVLDFDSMITADGKDRFIVFYKKITINHTQNNTAIQSVSSAPQGPSRVTQIFPWPGYAESPSESFLVSGNRKVEYFLYWRADDVIEKVKLAEFNSTVSGDGSSLIHTATGQRMYGFSCQVSKKMIVYHYLLEDYSGTPEAPSYDSPMNFEDISYSGPTRQWTPKNIIVGCILAGKRIHKEFGPESDPVIYSVGLHKRPDIEVEV